MSFRELERKAKEEEERMIKLKEEELLNAKTAAKKDVKDPMKKKSTAEVREGEFPPRTAANALRPSRDVDFSSLLKAVFFMFFSVGCHTENLSP